MVLDPAISGLGNACTGFDAAEIAELDAIARRYGEASGFVMKLAEWAGKATSTAIGWAIPDGFEDKVHEATALALRQAYDIAFSTQADASSEKASETMIDRARAWAQGERWHKVATGVTGALGGLGGIATTIIDLPVTTTLILRSIQQIAAEHGEDLSDPAVRAQCIAVFGLGGPLPEDDETDTGLWAARMALNGRVVAEMLARVLPRYGVIVGEKALAQATPLIGAVIGGTINPVFTGYYQTMAHVHFRLRKLERIHQSDQIRACFERIVRRNMEADKQARHRP
jgi:hypothetical protein